MRIKDTICVELKDGARVLIAVCGWLVIVCGWLGGVCGGIGVARKRGRWAGRCRR